MDKSKKASGKKNKTVGSSQSAAKGRDVTDSSNARHKAAAAAAPFAVEVPDKQTQNNELSRLKEENQQLLDLKRRHEAEISALRRSDAKMTELVNSLMGVSQSSSDTGDMAVEQILSSCLKQRRELLEIKKLSERQSVMLKSLRETVTSGGCARCTFRRSYEDLDVTLMAAVQCTEPPSTDQTRQVLLNDGRQFVLTTASISDSGVYSLQTNPMSASSHAASMRVTARADNRTEDEVEVPNDLALQDETPAAAAVSSTVPACPVCQQSGFATLMELNVHVNNTHFDVEDNMD